MAKEAFIKIEGLTKWYKDADTPAVNSISLNINQGEIFGLLGPNGAGKTTTISILCNQIQATDGIVFIDGRDLFQEKESLKKIIGVVPQEIALYPTLTAYENLSFFGNMYGLKGNDLKEKIILSCSNFGLEHRLYDKVKTFSGGMKRRVNLIAGILHTPKILILDEPTVGIDVQSKNVIIDHLSDLNQKEGTTIIYTSHMMEEAERICTQIAILDMGEVISQGKPEDLIAEYKTCENLEDIFLLLTGRSLRD